MNLNRGTFPSSPALLQRRSLPDHWSGVPLYRQVVPHPQPFSKGEGCPCTGRLINFSIVFQFFIMKITG